MKTSILLGIIVATLSSATFATGQVVASGDLADHMDSIIADMPTTNGGGDYLQPNLASRDLWREIVDHILAGEYADAHTKALTKNYQVVLYTDTEGEEETLNVLLERTAGSTSRYWGTFVFSPSPLRSHLVIQCPHPRYDLNTGRQGIRIYLKAGAKAYFVAGTHRCNGISTSPCDGTSAVCTGSYEAYRYSDQAHVAASTFQVGTEALLAADPDLLVVQPHGYGQGSTDPDVIMSNGTRMSPTGTDYTVAIRDALQAIDPTITAKVGHVDLSWTKLLGTTNTQGRLVNGSGDPCEWDPASASGNFVHIEQARVGLRDTPTNWLKLANAIIAAVPSDVSAVPQAHLMSVEHYPNPFNPTVTIAYEITNPGHLRVEIFDMAGRRVRSLWDGNVAAGRGTLQWNGTDDAGQAAATGVYFYRVDAEAGRVVRKVSLVK